LVTGNPAKFRYWVSKTGEQLIFNSENYAIDSEGNKYQFIPDEKVGTVKEI
jgi:hypothetical protein